MLAKELLLAITNRVRVLAPFHGGFCRTSTHCLIVLAHGTVMPGLTRLCRRHKSCFAGDSSYVSCKAWSCLVLPYQRNISSDYMWLCASGPCVVVKFMNVFVVFIS